MLDVLILINLQHNSEEKTIQWDDKSLTFVLWTTNTDLSIIQQVICCLYYDNRFNKHEIAKIINKVYPNTRRNTMGLTLFECI